MYEQEQPLEDIQRLLSPLNHVYGQVLASIGSQRALSRSVRIATYHRNRNPEVGAGTLETTRHNDKRKVPSRLAPVDFEIFLEFLFRHDEF